jgi:hypothetical protein
MAIMTYPQRKLALSGATGRPQAYYEVPLETRIDYAVMVLRLAAFLAIMGYEPHEMTGR